MKVTQQKCALPIENLDFVKVSKNSKHGVLLPDSFRAIFCGPSGCGKTNAMLSLLFNPNGAKFKNVYVYSKSLYQPKYQLLQDVLAKVKGMGYFPFKDNDEIIDPAEAREHSIFIFDDVARWHDIKFFFSTHYVERSDHAAHFYGDVMPLKKKNEKKLRKGIKLQVSEYRFLSDGYPFAHFEFDVLLRFLPTHVPIAS